ncbi:hypothetical protein PQ786_03230 [Alcaligenes faecalis]
MAITVDTDVDLGGADGTVSGLDRVLEGFHLANTGAVGVVWRVSKLAICTNSQRAVFTFKRRCTVGTYLLPIDMGHFGAFASRVVIEHITVYSGDIKTANFSMVKQIHICINGQKRSNAHSTGSTHDAILTSRQIFQRNTGLASTQTNQVNDAIVANAIDWNPVTVIILHFNLGLGTGEQAHQRTGTDSNGCITAVILVNSETYAWILIENRLPNAAQINQDQCPICLM